MRALEYAFREGWSGLKRGRGASALAVLAIALAMVVLGALLVVTWNAERLIVQWTDVAEVSVYLEDDATSDERGAIEATIDVSQVAVGREYVSKADASARFQREFSEFARLASQLDDNPFPASVEVQLDRGAVGDARIDTLVEALARMAGVADVRYDEEWLSVLSGVLVGVRRVGFGLALVMGLAAAVTVAAVVRLGLYARREEIEIMQLVGSPVAFIRGPFVVEGFLQGGIGAMAALIGLWAGFGALVAIWEPGLTSVFSNIEPAFLPARLAAGLILGGMAVGAIGGLLASRHAV